MKINHITRFDGYLTIRHNGHTYIVTGEIDGGSVTIYYGSKRVDYFRSHVLASVFEYIDDYAELT